MRLIRFAAALFVLILVAAACGVTDTVDRGSASDLATEPTPEPTSEATPDSTPEATPDPTPEPTPEATPNPTPEPTPEATPDLTPQATPEPTPEPATEALGIGARATPSEPCVDGLAGDYPCKGVGLASFLSLDELGGGRVDRITDIWGWADPETDREYIVATLSFGTAYVDVTDPNDPILVGTLPLPDTALEEAVIGLNDVKVHDDHAFIVSETEGHGLAVVDLTQLRDVTAPPLELTQTAAYSGFSTAHNIAIDEETGFAFAVGSRGPADECGSGLHIVDVNDPLDPVFAGCFADDGYTHDTQCVVYRGPDPDHQGREVCFASNEDTLTVVDVSDKAAPEQLARAPYPEVGYTHQGWLTEDHSFFLLGDEFDEASFDTPTRTLIWDVRDLDAPALIGVYEADNPATDHNLYIEGNLVYEANYRSGMRVLDASEVATGVLTEVGFFDTYPPDDRAEFASAFTAYPWLRSGAVAISSMEDGLFLVVPDPFLGLGDTG